MAKSRRNKRNRHQAILNTTVEKRQPEEVVILEKEIPHEAYSSVLVVLDGVIQERSQRFRTGLKIARDMPIYAEPAELPEEDAYVMFYRSFVDGEDEPLFTLENAQKKAHGAYQGQLNGIAQNAIILTLLYYTTFAGDVPEIEEEASDEEMLEAGLPPMLTRGMWSPLEVKLNHINHMMVTDEKFAAALNTAVNTAVAKAKQDGLMGAAEQEEEVSEEGFPSSPTD